MPLLLSIKQQDIRTISVKTRTSGSVSEPVLRSRAGNAKCPMTIHQWNILGNHMLPLKDASFLRFASWWGRLKRAGRVLEVLINGGTSNMFRKNLHVHTGTLNYNCTPLCSLLLLFLLLASFSLQITHCQLPCHFSTFWQFEDMCFSC